MRHLRINRQSFLPPLVDLVGKQTSERLVLTK